MPLVLGPEPDIGAGGLHTDSNNIRTVSQHTHHPPASARKHDYGQWVTVYALASYAAVAKAIFNIFLKKSGVMFKKELAKTFDDFKPS